MADTAPYIFPSHKLSFEVIRIYLAFPCKILHPHVYTCHALTCVHALFLEVLHFHAVFPHGGHVLPRPGGAHQGRDEVHAGVEGVLLPGHEHSLDAPPHGWRVAGEA